MGWCSAALADEAPRSDVAEVTVVGTPQSRYEARRTDTITRTGADLIDIARSIDVIPEQLLLDQQVRELEDVYRMAPNVVNVDGFGGTREDYLIRGFRRRDDIYRNGVRLKTSSRIDPATVESVQIVKGPVADLGQMTPGGLINVVTKKPEFDAGGSASVAVDEHGQRRGTLDVTGPLSQSVAYRLTISGEDSETFRKAELERIFVSSSLLWRTDGGASASLNHEFSKDSRDLDRGFVTLPIGGGLRQVVDAPRSRRFDEPALSDRTAKYHFVEFAGVLPLNEDWRLETRLAYVHETTADKRAEVTGVSAAGVLSRQIQGNRDRSIDTRFGRVQLVGDFDFGVPATLVVGVEAHRQEEDWFNFAGAVQTGGTVANPRAFRVVDDSSTAATSFQDVNQESWGPYAQLELEVSDQLRLTAGLRYESFDGDFLAVTLATGARRIADPKRDDHLSKSFGAVWQPAPSLSLYASYADTFQSQNIFSGDGVVTTLDPEEGRQHEVGVKWAGMDDRIFVTAAVFDIKQSNVVETVNGVPVLTGGIRSRGWEAAVVANPIPGLNIRSSIGVVDAEIVSRNVLTDGGRPANVPATTLNLRASYEVQSGPAAGLGVAGGVSHVGDRFGDTAHTFGLAGYTVFDGGLWYYLPIGGDDRRVRVDVGVKNITDERFFSASGGTNRIAVGAPRTLYGALRFEF